MKLRTMVFAVLAAAPACSKPNDLPAMQENAQAIAKYNDAKVAAFERRATMMLLLVM